MPTPVKRPQQTTEQEDKLKPFKFFGLSFRTSGNQSISDCPLCGKDGHFYVKTATGQFDCKKCGEKGNAFSFIRSLHSLALEETTEKDWKQISKFRKGIPWQEYRDAGIAKYGDEWLIPVFNEEGKICNLFSWEGPGSKMLPVGGLTTQLSGIEQLRDCKDMEAVHVICEGYWDRIAAKWAIGKTEYAKSYLTYSVPGASTFKTDWVEKFKNRHVVLLYDNDDPGKKGIERAEKLLAPVAKSLRRINWPEGASDGYDVNDFIAERLKDPKKAVSDLFTMLVPSRERVGGGANVTPAVERPRIFKTRPTFQQVVKEFRAAGIHLDTNMENTLAILYAVTLSNQIPTDCPVWIFIVAPPGAGKTLLSLTFSDAPACVFLSNLKPHALISGYKPSDDPSDDPSLLPKLTGKTLVIKDYTEVLSLPTSTQEELYGVLRGAYDGRAEMMFGNGIHRVYPDCHFTLLAGVTTAIHGANRASLGERFLKVNMLDKENHDKVAHIRAALKKSSDVKKFVEQEARLKQVSYEFLDVQLDLKKFPKIPPEYNNRIINLAQLLADLRADVSRHHGGELAYEPESEVGTRPAKQLDKLARALAYVFNRPVVDERCYRLVEKVAFDSCIGWNLRIVACLIRNKKPMEIPDVAYQCGMSYSNVNRRLENMVELNIVTRAKIEKGGKGRPSYGYVPTADFLKRWSMAKIDERRFRVKAKDSRNAMSLASSNSPAR